MAMLINDFRNSGGWLFRYRSYIPIILLIPYIIALFEKKNTTQEPTQFLFVSICFFISICGWLIRVITIGYTTKSTSGRNVKKQVADSLNTTRMYSIVRHPLYLGNYFIGLGFFLLPSVWWLVIIYTLAFYIYYTKIMITEEAFLYDKFQETYMKWCDKTPAFFPNFSNYKKDKESFSIRVIIAREYDTLCAIIFCYFLFEVLEKVTFSKLNSLAGFRSLDWIEVFAISAALWLVIRFLRKQTHLLKKENRTT